MVFDGNLNRFNQNLAALFDAPNQPTRKSRETALEEKERLNDNPSSDSFFLELRIGPPASICWTSNTQQLLGCRHLSFEDFIRRVHPDYHSFYFSCGIAAYQLMWQHKSQLSTHPVAYNILVPLQHDNGQYYWFNQFSRPSGISEDHILTHHINTYRFIGLFNGTMLLSRPYVLFQSEAIPGLQKELQALTARAMMDLLLTVQLEGHHRQLAPIHLRVLKAWCKVYANEGPGYTHHQSVANELGLKPGSVKKYVQPVLSAARLAFPLYPIREMNDLGRLMMGLFGVEN
jgi:hypothetical protein